MPYISITGLKLKHKRHALRFWWYAIAAMAQAKKAEGLMAVDARTINGVHHTRTVWTNEAAMRRYLVAGAHLKAMKGFGAIATGKTMGFESDQVPDWDEVRALWETKARIVGGK
ncbi:hypothetical protein NAC44_07205 [Allorhizobium sp. BGMRC 0089]|uniref:hypothetical protein n=1 Tax=Allorhizobium sonneratiae TaxID=2934936 RepID=UPI0020343D9F|nr:hypothetical protein [Allorhizobium sonneratiae]MCM2292119.1 hypothetical protein [Allorhizobium sonneratiae]